MATTNIPVLFVLDDNGEANGTVRYYCSRYCRTMAMQVNEDSIAEGYAESAEVLPTTRCQYCEQPVQE